MGRSWLAEAPESSVDAVLKLRPELAERYDALIDTVWRSGVDPVLLELCRIRMAQLLGDAAGAAARTPAAVVAGFSEQLAVRLDEWWSYPSFGEQERSALAVAEQFVSFGRSTPRTIPFPSSGRSHPRRCSRSISCDRRLWAPTAPPC